MADVHEPEVRSYNMSRIKGKDTKPEMLVRKFIHKHGLRYRLHNKNLPGKPDIVLKKHNTVIFINGCFWHGHDNCKYFKIPKSRTVWWSAKIGGTKTRDQRNYQLLKETGWSIVIIWECKLKPDKRHQTLNDELIKDIKK